MCQLTFVDLGTVNLNRLALSTYGVLNSRTINNDGVGIFQFQKKTNEYTIFKTHLAPINITNWGDNVKETIETKDPAFMHVRNATYFGTSNTKIVSDSKAHPFESKEFVLAHNGTLELRYLADERKYEKDELIDTEIFVKVLSKEFKGITFSDALKKTMKKFYGKFAFLIFEKGSKDYYIVRGKEKVLHLVNIYEETGIDTKGEITKKHIGVIINTDKDDLILGLQVFIQNARWIYNKKLFADEEVKLLDEETIFKYHNKELIKVGEIKEESRYGISTVVNKSNHSKWSKTALEPRQPLLPNNSNTETAETEIDSLFLLGEELELYISEVGFTYRELDQLCFELFNKTHVELEIEELKTLIYNVLPILVERVSIKKVKIWNLITLACKGWPDLVYEEHTQLSFPYMLNSFDVLVKVAKSYNISEENYPFIKSI